MLLGFRTSGLLLLNGRIYFLFYFFKVSPLLSLSSFFPASFHRSPRHPPPKPKQRSPTPLSPGPPSTAQWNGIGWDRLGWGWDGGHRQADVDTRGGHAAPSRFLPPLLFHSLPPPSHAHTTPTPPSRPGSHREPREPARESGKYLPDPVRSPRNRKPSPTAPGPVVWVSVVSGFWGREEDRRSRDRGRGSPQALTCVAFSGQAGLALH